MHEIIWNDSILFISSQMCFLTITADYSSKTTRSLKRSPGENTTSTTNICSKNIPRFRGAAEKPVPSSYVCRIFEFLAVCLLSLQMASPLAALTLCLPPEGNRSRPHPDRSVKSGGGEPAHTSHSAGNFHLHTSGDSEVQSVLGPP